MKRWNILGIIIGCLVFIVFLITIRPFGGTVNSQTIQRRALLVGVTTYKDAIWNNLRFPADDAKAIAEVMIDQQVGGWRNENIKILCDENATRENFKNELLQLLKVSERGDFVLVYFSGHGAVSGKNAFLAMYDTDPKNLDGTGYDLDELRLKVMVLSQTVKQVWNGM